MNEADEITSVVARQWGMVVMLQNQCSIYPSLENLEKLTVAIEGYKELMEAVLAIRRWGAE